LKRQRSPASFLLIAIVSSLVVAVVGSSPASAKTRPSIVIIMSDDQRWDSLVDMPTVMSRIAGRGALFPNAMVPTSLCCPSRASTLLGRYAHHTTVWNNQGPWGGWQRFFDRGYERSNLATWLDGRGYRTALIGKYLNGFRKAPLGHVPRGWDVWRAFRRSQYYDYELQVGETISEHGDQPEDYSTDVLARMADGFIRSTRRRVPLFLYLAPFGVHSPYTPAPRHAGSCSGLAPWRPPSFNEADVSDKPGWLSVVAPLRDAQIAALDARRRGACETLRSVDDMVATVMNALAATDRLGHTLVVYLSDNGLLWGEHRLSGKSQPYDAATRIPMAIRFDGRVAAGSSDPRLALNVDVASTVLDAAGIRPPASLDGRSLLRRWQRSGFVLEAAAGPNGRPAYCGWRTKDAWYVQYDGGDAEFYRLNSDPWELRNAIDSPRLRDRIRKFRKLAREACDRPPPGFHW
jgi:N-acetylglucosamine-6-sulfatase